MSNHDEIVKLIREMEKRKEKNDKELETYDYDGIFGKPPKWVPEVNLENFRKNRDRVLIDWEYSHDAVILWLDRFSKIGSDEDDNWEYPSEYPCGEKLDVGQFIKTMDYLSYLRWCIGLGPVEGLRRLSGNFAAQGYKSWVGSKKGRKDALAITLEETYISLLNNSSKRPTNGEVLKALEYKSTGDLNDIIQEIDWFNERICWLNQKGIERDTSFKQFRDRMTKIRKRQKGS
ncbi:MAG: hypothetical protein AB2747_05815 [Candidatus Thiodiazotropha taylori]